SATTPLALLTTCRFPSCISPVLDLGVDDIIDSYNVPEPESEAEIADRLINRPFNSPGGVERES
ncbi:MAG: hypothetical protein L0L93_11555, partial [Brevibacterium sp.]|nr:hypothetical protein [Brevibacterium sp.]